MQNKAKDINAKKENTRKTNKWRKKATATIFEEINRKEDENEKKGKINT